MTIRTSHSFPRVASRRVLFLNANETMRPYRVTPLGLAFVASALWTAEELVRCTSKGWNDLPVALARYARNRARRQFAKSELCELFKCVILRPWLANSVLQLLGRRQSVADSFIGIVGNSYTPARGPALIALHAVSF